MDYFQTNQESWDQRTRIHVKSEFYDVLGFINGKSSLNNIELELLGSVKNKSLLHLQCHFGLDSLSWVRNGAKVTGVDISPEAVKQATTLTNKCNLQATFICDDLYSFGEKNDEEFDIVFSSYGVLNWLPDLNKWAQVITKSLKPGGRFYLVEFHPVFDLISGYSYFHTEKPDIEEEGTYTENCDGKKSTLVTWSHSLSDVINSLIGTGLKIESFQEYSHSPYDCFDGLERDEGAGFKMLHNGNLVPILYSVVATKL